MGWAWASGFKPPLGIFGAIRAERLLRGALDSSLANQGT